MVSIDEDGLMMIEQQLKDIVVEMRLANKFLSRIADKIALLKKDDE